MYGLLLKNSNESDMYSNVIIENLYIHDLIINPKQVIKISISNDLWLRNSFNIPIDLNIAINNSNNNNNNILNAIYYGDVYTNALIALKQLTNSWWLLGKLIIWDEFIQWSQSDYKPLKFVELILQLDQVKV